MRNKQTVNTIQIKKNHNKKKFESQYFLPDLESSSFFISPFRSFCTFSTNESCWAVLSSTKAFYYLAVQGGSNCDNSNESYWAILSSGAVWTLVILQLNTSKSSLFENKKKNGFYGRLKEIRPLLSDFKAEISSSSHWLSNPLFLHLSKCFDKQSLAITYQWIERFSYDLEKWFR